MLLVIRLRARLQLRAARDRAARRNHFLFSACVTPSGIILAVIGKPPLKASGRKFLKPPKPGTRAGITRPSLGMGSARSFLRRSALIGRDKSLTRTVRDPLNDHNL